MRKYSIPYAILCAMLFAGLLLFFLMPIATPAQDINLSAINEITKQAAKHWEDPGELQKSSFAYRFVLLSNKNRVLFMSHEGLPNSLASAIRRGFVPMDIVRGTSIIGKALVEVYPADAISRGIDRQRVCAWIAAVIFCALSAAFLWAVHRTLALPFKRLELFAHRITTGRFDEPLPMDRYNLFGLFTQSFDIMRTSLQEARQKQLQAERAKKELIASLSHDIKTPVTSIRIISELLQAGNRDSGTIEKLKTIEQKANQIDRLMNDLLHSALEELGELTVSPVSTESSVLRKLFLNAGPVPDIHIGPIPACLIELDIMRIEQVIENIFANSRKYAGTKISIAFQINGELLQIDINDYGSGVGLEELELITTKFYRGENAKTAHKEGEGLGLYIAKVLMEKMGGGLEALNRDDGFTIRLWIRLSR